jgi:hypothetical protein
MEIQIGKSEYWICSDPLNLILTEQKTVEKGDNAGDLYFDSKTQKYYNSMSELYDGFVRAKIRRSDAKTINELKDDIAAIHQTIKDHFASTELNLTAKILSNIEKQMAKHK